MTVYFPHLTRGTIPSYEILPNVGVLKNDPLSNTFPDFSSFTNLILSHIHIYRPRSASPTFNTLFHFIFLFYFSTHSPFIPSPLISHTLAFIFLIQPSVLGQILSYPNVVVYASNTILQYSKKCLQLQVGKVTFYIQCDWSGLVTARFQLTTG